MKKTFNFWIELKNYSIITVCLFGMALGWTAFLIPNHMLGGGVSGIATVIYWVTGISTGITIFAINAVLILISFKNLGWRFGLKTIYCIIIMSLLFSLLQKVFGDKPLISDKFLAAVIGGGISGLSNGLIFVMGGSTGGTDIITMLVNKYRNISLGRFTLIMNVVIIVCSLFVFRSVETFIYSFVNLMINSYCLDLTLTGSKQSVQMFIFSSKSAILANIIGNELHRGVTVLKGVGWYTQTEFEILMVIVRKSELQSVIRVVKREDEKAFVSVNTVMGVYGKGFDVMKR